MSNLENQFFSALKDWEAQFMESSERFKTAQTSLEAMFNHISAENYQMKQDIKELHAEIETFKSLISKLVQVSNGNTQQTEILCEQMEALHKLLT